MSNMTTTARQGYLEKVVAGTYEVLGRDGETYQLTRDYGVGTTRRGWSAFRKDGSRWVGTPWSADTLRDLKRQMTLRQILWLDER